MISLYFFSFVLLSPLHFFMHLVLMPCLLWLRSLLFYTFHWILGLINIIICTFIILYCDPVLFQLFLIIAFATCYCSWALTPSPPPPGPASVRMISTNASPPIPLPVQVPPGHVVQQIVDETGTLRHVILSAQPVPMPMCPYVSTECWLCWPELSICTFLRCFLSSFSTSLFLSLVGVFTFLACWWKLLLVIFTFTHFYGEGRGATLYHCLTCRAILYDIAAAVVIILYLNNSSPNYHRCHHCLVRNCHGYFWIFCRIGEDAGTETAQGGPQSVPCKSFIFRV